MFDRYHTDHTLPLPSLVFALRSGGAGAAGGTTGAAAAAALGAAEAGTLVSEPPSVPVATMFSTAAATLAAARAALAVADPYNTARKRETLSQNALNGHNCDTVTLIGNTLRGLLVLNSLHLAIINVIILDTAILGFLAAIKGLGIKKKKPNTNYLKGSVVMTKAITTRIT